MSRTMSTLSTRLREAASAQQFAKEYFEHVSGLLERLDPQAIAAFMDTLAAARESDRTVFIVGNGGSAATASHMATDLGARKADGLIGLRAVALTDNTAMLTATANDHGYPEVFVAQLEALYRLGDLLIVISASGNSPNILRAARWVKERQGKVLGMVGFDGGAVKALCDVVLHVPTPAGEYGPVEDIHLMLNHLMSAWLRQPMRSEQHLCKSSVS